MISIIVATSLNWAIGRNNQLLWHISEDLKYFKKITSGHTVIMGRKTWESIGKPLPNRRNIVVSRSLEKITDAEVYKSLELALKAAGNESLFIIGGGEIYEQALPLAEKLYLTIVNLTVEDADTFFPKINFDEWRETSREVADYGTRLELVRISQ